MAYLSSLSINTDKKNPFPFNIPAVQYAKNIDLTSDVTFLIGDNGTGKSTLLESLAFRLQLPHMDGSSYSGSGFKAARLLAPFLELTWQIERSVGFFFRAEDFGDLINSIDRQDAKLHHELSSLHGEVPDSIINEMKENANYQLHHMRRNFGQNLQSFSHGEAYLQIMHAQINNRGIFLLDEPEAALSPSKQLSLIFFIKQHLKKFNSQFIIVTHSPILMAYPGASIYEINADGMNLTALEETEHYSITKSFLNNPASFLRHLD